jgi:ferric enterobactin receptor
MANLATRAFWVCVGLTWPTIATAQALPAQDPTESTAATQDDQQATPPTGATPTRLSDVEVAATLPAQADRIDRRVYNVASDPLAQSSTALEVIGRLPSVSVSTSGTITLLGQGTASLLIDGKPVANAEALRVLQGGDLDRVEVMTNPSSEFRAQGTGGVVNVITRRRRPIGLSGNVLASADTLDNLRLSVSTSTSFGKLTLRGNASVEETASRLDRSRIREALVPTADTVSETSAFRVSGDDATLGLSATYAFDEMRSLTWGGTVSRARSENSTRFFRTISGPTSAAYEELSLGEGGVDAADANVEFSVRALDRRLLMKLSGTVSSNDFFTVDEYARTFDPSDPQTLFGMTSRYATDKTSIAATLEYDPTENLVIKAGVTFDLDSQRISRLTDTAQPGEVETSLSGDIGVWAVYGSVQWPVLGWTVMPGLRAEQAAYEIDNAALVRRDEIDLFPSLHLRRPLSPDWTINLSYSGRINRPDLGRLDPRPVFSSATEVSVGAPDLVPEFTDALEARLEHVSGDNNASATLYHRITSDVWQPFFSLNADQIIVQTMINAGTRTNTGLELSMRRAFSPRYRITGTANIFRSEKDVLVGSALTDESSTEFSTNLALTFKPRGSDPTSDTFQWSLSYSGRSQGYQTTSSAVLQSSLSWRRPITDRLVSVLTISDLFDSGDQTFVLTTSEFRQRLEARGDGPQVRWTLAWRFGARQ